MKEKIKILTDLGFVPMVEGEGNTLFRMNDVVMSVSDPNQTPEQLKKGGYVFNKEQRHNRKRQDRFQ